MYTAIDKELGGGTLSEQPITLSARRCADGNGTLTYLFFSEEWVDVQRAKAICAKCSSRDECLSGALERQEPWGVWGGEQVEKDRKSTRLNSSHSSVSRMPSSA